MKHLIVIALLFSCLPAAFANSVVTSIQRDIKQAQATLSRTEKQLASENKQLSEKLLATEKRVIQLRKESEGLIRAQDEAALSIEQVENRLSEWQQQSQFQNHLLTRYLNANDASVTSTELSQLLISTKRSFNYLADKQGQFYSSDIVLIDGNTVSAELINIGPFRYFLTDQYAGLIDVNSQHNEVSVTFNNEEKQALTQLKNANFAMIPVDPSNGRATARIQQQETIVSHVAKGGVWIAPILLFAAFALAIALYKFVQLSRLDKIVPAVTERLASLNGELELLKLGHWQTELVTICQQTQIGQQRDDKLFNALNEQKKQLDNLLGAIAVTAAVAPLLGLLGTVSGMIETFKLMTLFGAGDPAAVSGGISEALVTTELGLVVAIPALLCHAFLSRKVKSYYHQLEQCAISLSQHNFKQPIELSKGAA